MKKRVDQWLVQCPHASDVYYFLWHCRANKALGVSPCVDCEAMENLKPLQEVMDEITRG